MKKIIPLIVSVLINSTFLMSCDGLLGVDSKRLTTDDEYGLKSSGDSIYSTFGLFSQLQKLADSYVLLGELRADLLDISATSDPDLREINALNITENNIYVNIKDYYAVINNCNYIIQHLDTNVVDQGQKLKLRQYAAVKSIRAWTYMQIALNFKEVKYYTNPILTVADAERTDYQVCNMEQLAPLLIADLEPLKIVGDLNLGVIDSYNTSYSIFPVRFLLGDLYLWTGEYEKSAIEYRELIYEKRIVINKDNTSYWVSVNNTISSSAYVNWLRSFVMVPNGEVITTIMCPTEYGQNFYLDSLNSQRKIIPSSISISNWDSQTYYLNEASNSQGDLRKYGSIWYKEVTTNPTSNNSYTGESGIMPYIYKYKINPNNVIIYRSSLLYLRYAEAVNRLNKPKLAFAVLKYGLNSTNLYNEKIVPTSEKGSPIMQYVNFSDIRFNNNVGIRMRGLGNMDKDTTFYRIPKLNNMNDSVLYVEDLIQQELALETAFEGNRFHDLMRFALRRDDPAYLADKVVNKHPEDKASFKAKLSNPENWYIKY